MKNMTFEKAFKRLKEISEILEKEEIIDVDKLIKYQEEAKELQDYCKKKIKTSEEKLTDKEKNNG